MFFLISCFPGNSLVVSLGYLPGHIHAFWLIYKKMQAEERYGHGGFRCMYSIFLFLGILGINNGPIHLHRPWFGPLWAALSIWSLPRPILSFTYAYFSTPPASSAVLRGNSSVLINFSVTPRTSFCWSLCSRQGRSGSRNYAYHWSNNLFFTCTLLGCCIASKCNTWIVSVDYNTWGNE